jgi:hypothetical protein
MMACSLVVLLCGCAYSLHPYNAPSVQSLKIVSDYPQRYSVRVDDKLGNKQNDYSVGSDGVVSFQVPSLPRGCAVLLFGVIKIADHQSEDVKAILLIKDRQAIRALSLNDISKLPADLNGVRQLKTK